MAKLYGDGIRGDSDGKCSLIKNEGHVKVLYMKNIDAEDDVISGSGIIDKEVSLL